MSMTHMKSNQCLNLTRGERLLSHVKSIMYSCVMYSYEIDLTHIQDVNP